MNNPGCLLVLDRGFKMSALEKARSIPVVGDSTVLVGPGLFSEIPKDIKNKFPKTSKFVIVSDKTVYGLYGDKLLEGCKAQGLNTIAYQITPGEKSKCRKVKAEVEDFMLENRCLRDTLVIALGGGVVGDLAGFVAATYLRGVPVVQIPTSVMAMVDSSVGGKTAINVPAGKNLIGAFHQPRVVYADMLLLKTLTEKQVKEGLAEAVKMGCIRNAGLFDYMEKNAEKILKQDSEALAEVIYTAIKGKADVVAQDEKEKGLRSTLNFGHTIGHAVEALEKKEVLYHGECVAIGMVHEMAVLADMGHLDAKHVDRITECLKAYNLPTDIPEELKVEDMMKKMKIDKKNKNGQIRITCVQGIGKSLPDPIPIDEGAVSKYLKSLVKGGS
mmetsp:Transcript_33917/g.47413  ORF Transcript_33917/g.47413 Transcript_33917/m.47413 type:complete len:386 (+) Transcript_33917:60-1217(+)|eukprot:jgi/Bigna1/84957/estExt_fgenesh1_pg.C_10466